jgi:NAD(P)H-quinone oxidoreductase subunit 4
VDAEPREVFVIASLLVPVIGIGLYPKVVTQMYDSTTTQLTALMRQSMPTLVKETPVAKSDRPFVSMVAPKIGE